MSIFLYSILYLFFTCTNTFDLHAEFFFSNKESRMHLSQNTQMKLYSAINNWNGTLKSDPGSSIEGSSISFSNGSLESGQQKTVLKGRLDPSAQTILLQGSDILHANPGTVLQIVNVSGTNNRIEGQPTFQTPITFFDSSTSLTLALQKKLNNSIILNGGTLFLDDDLRLGEEVLLNGPGIVECNQASIHIWGSDGTWNSTLSFINPDALFINSHLMLSSAWTLSGKGNLNGQGNVLDLSLGGKLIIGNDAEICISDIKIRGLNASSLIFSNEASKIRLSDVQLELDSNYSMTLGGIFIDNSVTFLLKNYNFLVDTNASITFDGARGVIDGLLFADDSSAGQFQSPLPLFIDHTFVTTNFNANIISGNLTLLSSGTLSELARGGDIFINTTQMIGGGSGIGGGLTPTGSYILSTIITVTYVGLDDTFWVPVNENVIAGTDVTIDASGNAMFFAHGEAPQIIVLPQYTLTLKNIEFGRINENTFNIHPSSKLFIDENVQFEFNQNITFSQGSITLTTNADVFHLRGMGGVKTLNIAAPAPGQPKFFNAGANTLVLQNIELNGLENIAFESKFINGELVKGAVALTGGARININRTTDAVFIVEGIDNVIRILKNDISLDGSLIFGDEIVNELHIDFVLTSGLFTENQVRFGDNFAYIYSEKGKAGLIFDDYLVNVINKGSNSFVMDKGSYLDGNDLFIGTFPIKQLSADIGLSRGLLLSSDQSNAIDPTFIRSINTQFLLNQRPTTAYHLKQRSKKTAIEEIDTREAKEDINELLQLLKQRKPTRALETPSIITTQIDVGASVQLSNALGTIQMKQGSSITEFGIDPNNELNIILSDNCIIEQGSSATRLKASDALFVLGRGNILRVTNILEIEGQIFLDENAELIIECDRQNNNALPEILFGSNTVSANLTMPEGSRFLIRGDGKFLLAPGSKITSTSKTSSAELFLHDRIIMGMQDAGLVTISGNLSIQMNHLAEILAGPDQHILFGASQSLKNRDTINFLIDHQSRIRVDGTNNVNNVVLPATISIAAVNTSIIFDRGSELYIDNGGTFEMNSFNDSKVRGQLDQFFFGLHTSLHLNLEGKFILGPNNYNNNSKSSINWNLKRATLDAQGLFKLADSNFRGIPQNIAISIIASAEDILRTYINRAPNLQKSLYFLDTDQNHYLRTVLGIIIPLTITEDDLIERGNVSNCVVTGADESGKFSINIQGKRI